MLSPNLSAENPLHRQDKAMLQLSNNSVQRLFTLQKRPRLLSPQRSQHLTSANIVLGALRIPRTSSDTKRIHAKIVLATRLTKETGLSSATSVTVTLPSPYDTTWLHISRSRVTRCRQPRASISTTACSPQVC